MCYGNAAGDRGSDPGRCDSHALRSTFTDQHSGRLASSSPHAPKFSTSAKKAKRARKSTTTHQQPVSVSSRFVCGINGCVRSYGRRYELSRHQKSHSGIKSHSCRFQMCDRAGQNGFVRKDHLKQHLRQVHGVTA